MTVPLQNPQDPEPAPVEYDFDRRETDSCERLSPGCPVRHRDQDSPCEVW
jgi:hypothetical protein